MGTHPIFESDFDCLTEMSGKLYTYPDNFRADKIRAVANISGYKLDVASEYTHGVTNKTPEFQAKFFGKVQLSNLVTLPCVMTPQSPISLVMLKPVVAKDPLMSFAGLDSLKTPFSHLLPNGSGQHSPLFNQTRLI